MRRSAMEKSISARWYPLIGAGTTVLAAALLVACDGAAPAATNAPQPPARAGAQPLRFVVWRERLQDGRSLAQTDYQARVEACRRAGLPVQALSAQALGKVGRKQTEVWTDGVRYQLIDTEWRWQTPSPGSPQTACQFEFREYRRETRSDGEQARVRSTFPEEQVSAEQQEGGLRQALAADEAEEARQQNGALGWQSEGEQRIAGQACSRWRNENEGSEACMWSGGGRWGMSEAIPDSDCLLGQTGEALLDGLPLQARTAAGGGIGCRLQLETLVIGGAAAGPPLAADDSR